MYIFFNIIINIINQKDDFTQRKEEKVEELQDMVYNRMRHFGEGHETAANYVKHFIKLTKVAQI
jgi:hypothetical protein